MEYQGKLYGKVGKHTIPLEATTDDFEKLEADKKELLYACEKMLRLQDLWLISPENCPPEHRGEMEALSSMHGVLTRLLEKHP